MAEFSIEIASWQFDELALRRVREAVFVDEQRVPIELEVDADDPRAVHALARDADRNPIGTGRLTADGRIGRMAVLGPWRGRGVGDALLRTLVECARERGFAAVTLSAQLAAIDFYARSGFIVEGPEYDDAGIAHRTMRRTLAPFAPPERPGTAEIAAREQQVRVDGLTGAIAAVDRLIADARHELIIYTRDLDRALYEREAFIDAIKRIALSGRNAEIRVLIQEPEAPARDGRRLLHLAHRAPSAIQLRVPTIEEDRHYAGAYLVNDAGGFFFRPLGSRYDGEARFRAPGGARQLIDAFDQVWHRAEPSPLLRRLSL